MKRAAPEYEVTPKMAAYDRLRKDGAYNTEAVRRRIASLNLDPSETKELMKGKLTVFKIGQFIENHPVSLDWLLAGDLEGLRRMARGNLG